MAGYYGYSMSNNAIEAYKQGEKPLTKWKKDDILNEIRDYLSKIELPLETNFSWDLLKKIPIKKMKEYFLYASSWHHTSKMYNRTDFYKLWEEHVEGLTDEILMRLIEDSKKEKEIRVVSEYWVCSFLIWTGSRRHKKAIRKEAIGKITGDWFYLSDGTKKSIKAKGFRKLKKLQS